MICKLCVQKEGREAGEEGGRGQVSFKKKKMTLEQAFCLERQHVNVPLDTKQTVDSSCSMGILSQPSSRKLFNRI